MQPRWLTHAARLRRFFNPLLVLQLVLANGLTD
jgi:hypothetical protein